MTAESQHCVTLPSLSNKKVSFTPLHQPKPVHVFYGINMEHSGVDDSYEGPKAHADRKHIKLGSFRVRTFWANILFAFLAIAGQVGQNVSLPLWLAAAESETKNSKATSSSYEGAMDAYFVLSFASLFFVVAFGAMIIVVRLRFPQSLGQTEKSFPHTLLIAVGVCDALNGALVVFASPPNRTAPYLQAILGNFMIPLSILARLILLKKRPTLRKFSCGMVVLLALFICLLPSIFPKQLEPDKAKESGEGASGYKGALWALCFMIGFVPAALMNVVEEKGLKMQNVMSRRGVNIIYFLFWESVYQLLAVTALFWVDIIPGYGFAKNISEFGKNWWFGIRCFFGSAGCSSTPGIRGTMFVLMYMVSYLGGGLLLRYSEGATFVSIVSSLVTPLGFLFWTLFRPQPFTFKPETHHSTYFSIGALVLMIPAIYFYNTGPPEIDLEITRGHTIHRDMTPAEASEPSEADPLINKQKL